MQLYVAFKIYKNVLLCSDYHLSYLYKLVSFKRENYKLILKMPNYNFIISEAIKGYLFKMDILLEFW